MTRIVLLIAWIVATGAAGYATWRLMRTAGSSRLEALAAGYGAVLLVPTVATTWVLLLPLRPSIAILGGCLIVIAAAVLAIRSRLGRGPRESLPPSRGALLAASPVLAAIAGVVIVSLIAASRKPVAEVDALLYHGPAAANILQHGSLFGWDGTSPWIFYPNLGAAQAAVTAVLAQSVSFLDAVQAPYLGLLALVVWAWAGRGRPSPLIGAIALAAAVTPAAWVQGRTLYVDVIYAGALLAGVWLVGLWLYRRRAAYLGLGGLFVGAAAAVKPAGSAVAAAVAVGLVVFILVARRQGGLRAAALGVGAILAGALPFYLRNLIEFENPLYPVSFRIPGHRFPGLADFSAFTENAAPGELSGLPGPIGFLRNLVYGLELPPNPIFYDARLGAFGAVVAVLLVLALVGIAGFLWPGPTPRRRRLLMAAWPLTAAVALLLLQPQAWNPRYTLATFSLIVVLAGLGISYLRIDRAMGTCLAVTLLAVWAGLTWSTEHEAFQGLPETARLEASVPRFNDGVTGENPAYQDNYRWLAGAPCGTRVVVAGTQFQIGLLNAYNLGYWGDGLCNDVVVVRDVRKGGGDGLGGDRRRLEAAIPGADFVVVFEADRQLVEEVARRNGLTATVVTDPPDYFGADQIVYRIDRA